MSFVLDIAVITIVLVTFVVVMLRGFIKTVLDLTSVIFAIIFAKMFSASVSNIFYGFLYKHLSSGISELINNYLEKSELPTLLEQHTLLELLGRYNVELANVINSDNVNTTLQVVVQSVIGLLSYAIAFFMIFIITIIAFKILSVVLSTIFKLPILKTINKTLSFVLSVIMCFVYINLFVAFMQIITPVISSVYPDMINLTVIEQTYLFKFFYNFEWIKFLVN
jgi:uncharacterized membrane protein required for colicin V production